MKIFTDPIYVDCPTCGATQDRRCGDEDGEYAGGAYHPERVAGRTTPELSGNLRTIIDTVPQTTTDATLARFYALASLANASKVRQEGLPGWRRKVSAWLDTAAAYRQLHTSPDAPRVRSGQFDSTFRRAR